MEKKISHSDFHLVKSEFHSQKHFQKRSNERESQSQIESQIKNCQSLQPTKRGFQPQPQMKSSFSTSRYHNTYSSIVSGSNSYSSIVSNTSNHSNSGYHIPKIPPVTPRLNPLPLLLN